MASLGWSEDPLPEDELRRFVADIFDEGIITIKAHAEEEAIAAKVEWNDIRHGLKNVAWLLKKKEWNPDFREWKYTILTTDIEGVEFGIVVAVDRSKFRLSIVTVF